MPSSQSIPSSATPAMLAWARVQAGMDVGFAADKLRVAPDQIIAWESGERSPSMAKLRDIANVYRRPLAAFFLPAPPANCDEVLEFRRLPGPIPAQPSPALLWAVRQARYRRAAALELLEAEGRVPPPPDLALDTIGSPEELGGRLREKLGLQLSDQFDAAGRGDYGVLGLVRYLVESLGVLVFQSSRVSIREMRGICLPDPPLPVILLNASDAARAKVFTLMHEVVHLSLHMAGLGRRGGDSPADPRQDDLEVLANAAAAAALLPSTSLSGQLPANQRPFATAREAEQLANGLARKYGVSAETVLRRLVTIGVCSDSIYRECRVVWESRNSPKGEGGGAVPQHVLTISRVGRPFARLVLDSVGSGRTTLSEAADYLGVKPRAFRDIESALSGISPGQADA